MFTFDTEQKVCEVGGVKFGGQPGDYPCVCVSSIFQKGDRVFSGKRKEGFDEKRAEMLLKDQEKLSEETGVPGMADIVANTGAEFKTFIDFVTSVSDMPFCIDAWVMKPKLAAVEYCAEKGLMDRMFYNSLTVWEQDLETEIREISQAGVKHVLLVAFDQEDQMPGGRITGTQKLLDAIEKVGAEFESIFVDTSVMNGPATALCGLANRMIKEKWGFPTGSAPSNGSYMDLKRFKENWGFKGWASTDAALEGISAFFYHDMIFSGPMAGASRILPAVAEAEAFLATAVFAETKRLPKDPNHPLFKLFPDFVEQLKTL
ncbi:MAG: tetrahydromethanopterin S-methyltransferase subunit H [Desulfobacterales bacterium]|nr:tetrahydromethanopterin S-methyltransferase subunit H [Desulfobacterales bacterium]